MRFNKAKCEVLHLSWGNARYEYRWEKNLRAALQRRTWGSWWTKSCTRAAVCARSPEGQQHPGLHQQRAGSGQGGDCPPLLCPREAPSGALRPGLGPPAQERRGAVGAGPEEATRTLRGLQHLCCKDGLRSWGCSAWRRAGCGETSLQPSSS